MAQHLGTYMPGESPLVPDEPPCQDCTAYADIYYRNGECAILVHHDDTCPRLLALHRNAKGPKP